MDTIYMVGLLIGAVFLAWSGLIAIRREVSLRGQLELLQEQFAEYTRQCSCGLSVSTQCPINPKKQPEAIKPSPAYPQCISMRSLRCHSSQK